MDTFGADPGHGGLPPTELKGGQTTEDPRLDRVVQFDERSRNYPITAVLDRRKPRSYRWRCNDTLDQGQEGACVGMAFSHDHIARPSEGEATFAAAYSLYKEAQRLDEWPGEEYSGTSILAGAKAAQARGWLGEYRWAFGLDDLLLALSWQGPAILGIPWYESMYEPQKEGRHHRLRVEGRQVGGHAILARGLSTKDRTVTLRNSWGLDWGDKGDAVISYDDLDRLLHERGEACVPVR